MLWSGFPQAERVVLRCRAAGSDAEAPSPLRVVSGLILRGQGRSFALLLDKLDAQSQFTPEWLTVCLTGGE